MNKITLLNIEYLRPQRRIETYELLLKDEKEICYVYNFEDKYYRYVRPMRSIETYELVSMNEKEICYIYNYENTYFRYFKTIVALLNYLKDRIEPKVKFKEKTELTDYLSHKNIVPIEEVNKEFYSADELLMPICKN